MSALPTKLRVKRKREDASVGQLYLQEQQELEPHPRKRLWQYTLQPTFTSAAEVQRAIETESTASQNGTLATATQEQQTREFRIAPSRKRKAGDADIATFVEAKKARSSASDHATADAATQSGTAAREVKPLKRPGAGARLGHGKAAQQREEAKKLASSAAREERTNALAESLNRFAQETLEREREKPRLTVKPKVPALRLRDRHPERFAPVAGSNGSAADMDVDVDMDGSDEEGYVYDTYVRYQHPVVPSTLDASDPANVQIGYIVITEEDNPIWETYFEEEGSEEDVLSDDEDENGKTSCPFLGSACARS